MADVIYNSFRAALFGDTDLSGTPIDLDSDTIKVALTTSSYTPSTAHQYFSDISNEVSGTAYVSGGTALANKTVTYSGGTATFDADDVTWTNSTITARYGVVYKSTGTAGSSPLICALDFGSDKSSSSGSFTIQFSASGIVTLA